jgi:deoxyribodipyrimidine photolyase-related protein
MRLLRLILGDQLDPRHSWFSRTDPDVCYVMMEVRTETDYVTHHIQKILAVFAAMRRFAAERESEGHHVRYIPLDAQKNRHSFRRNLAWLLQETGADRVELQEPDEHRLARDLDPVVLSEELTRTVGRPISVGQVSTEHFLVSPAEADAFLPPDRKPVMEYFYRKVRTREGWLMEEDEGAGSGVARPVGGRWNYDTENRGVWKGPPRDPAPPPRYHAHNDLSEEYETVQRGGCRHFGEATPDDMPWPVTRSQALDALSHFVEVGLPRFGTYQDAMHTDEGFLFHSLLSFPLNVKLLRPREVIEAVLGAYGEGAVTDGLLPQVEGFIRQIAGWREYMRLLYRRMMPGLSESNALGADRPLPGWYWTGRTDMACMAAVIRQSLREAYAHHIQRLMITGNFALIAGVRPEEVDAWYLGIYIDAFDWVELPNTRGMSQYADGGVIATKPYAASASYIGKQSNYCHDCRYNPRTRTDRDSCPFNALYWDFYARNPSLETNRRIRFVYPTLRKMSHTDRDALAVRAQWLRDHLEEL